MTQATGSRSPVAKTREFLDMIKFEHTIFALPFAYLALFLVAGGWPPASLFIWITVAMVSGRTFGMAANRLIDARIDAANPRTAGRSLPAGRMKRTEVVLFIVISVMVFGVAVYNLSPLAQKLSPLVLIAMTFYPYAKRFTWLSHLALGLVYVMIPTGVWIAARNTMPPEALLLGLGAGFWVAGFDIIYSCQDVEVDRRDGLHSMPADFGVGPALWAARLFHGVFLAMLLWAGLLLDVGLLYYLGVGGAGLLMAYEHRLVSPNDLSRVDAAFFTVNGIISMMLFVLVAADTVFHKTI